MIDTSVLKEIFVVGRPRSGTVWLNRLLADALDSPLEAPGGKADAPKYFGPGRDGGYVVRKIHNEIKRGLTVFIQRDPRDVIVSTWFYNQRSQPLYRFVQGMCEPYVNSYERHIRMWLDDRTKAEFYTRYELLHENTYAQLLMTIEALTGKILSGEHLRAVVERQSFTTVKAKDTEGRFNHTMRSGKVGEWRKYFTSEIGQYMQRHMGNFLIEEGYVQERHWWKELPDKNLVDTEDENE